LIISLYSTLRLSISNRAILAVIPSKISNFAPLHKPLRFQVAIHIMAIEYCGMKDRDVTEQRYRRRQFVHHTEFGHPLLVGTVGVDVERTPLPAYSVSTDNASRRRRSIYRSIWYSASCTYAE
jgi:hypothetical protein